MSDEQQITKQGLMPSPSNIFPLSTNTNKLNDSTSGMKFLMVPGQNSQLSNFPSGKMKFDKSHAFEKFIFYSYNLLELLISNNYSLLVDVLNHEFLFYIIFKSIPLICMLPNVSNFFLCALYNDSVNFIFKCRI